MSKRGVSTLPALPHIPDLYVLLRLIDDKSYRKEVSDWVSAVEMERKEMNTTIRELIGAENVVDLQAEVSRLHREAKAGLDKALEEAAEELALGRSKLVAERDATMGQLEQVKTDNKMLASMIKAREDKVIAQETALLDKADELADDRVSLSVEREETEKLRKYYEDMVAKLKAAGFKLV